MRGAIRFVHGWRPVVVMVLVQTAFAGMNIFYKLAADDGMNLTVLVAYRSLFAAAFMVPLALFVERNTRPKFSWMVLFYAFLCGLFGGSLAQNLFAQSLALTSATYAAAMPNVMPAITFIMAISFGLEKLRLGTPAGLAKVIGSAVGIGGAMLFTFYKGNKIGSFSTRVHLPHHHSQYQHVSSSKRGTTNHVGGSLMALGSCVSYSLWLIVQAKMSRRYPAHYTSTALMCIMGSIQSVVFALCMERNWADWKLGFNIRLLTAAYTGIVTAGLVVILITWCVHQRGPLFVSVFSPLTLLIVAIVGASFLNEELHLGSVLGGVLIICGLYMVLWGKSNENKKIIEPSKTTQESEPTGTVVDGSDINGSNAAGNTVDGDKFEREREGEGWK